MWPDSLTPDPFYNEKRNIFGSHKWQLRLTETSRTILLIFSSSFGRNFVRFLIKFCISILKERKYWLKRPDYTVSKYLGKIEKNYDIWSSFGLFYPKHSNHCFSHFTVVLEVNFKLHNHFIIHLLDHIFKDDNIGATSNECAQNTQYYFDIHFSNVTTLKNYSWKSPSSAWFQADFLPENDEEYKTKKI